MAKKSAKASAEPKTTTKKPKIQAAQVRALTVLENADDPMDCKEIAKKAPFNKSWTTIHLGSADDEVRERNDTEYFPSLVSLKYVRLVAVPSDDGRDKKVNAYQITASGRKALERIRKASEKASEAKAASEAEAVAEAAKEEEEATAAVVNGELP